jgi:AraC-like DNA-binding protein
MENQEKNWTQKNFPKDPVVLYTNLEHGKYIFRVTACNNHGLWNDTGTFLAIRVKPSFFQSFYFLLAFFILAGASIAGGAVLWRRRINKIQNKYKKTKLPEDLAVQYQKKLQFLLEKEKIYRDSSLSLKNLASSLSVPAHHLSQVINQKFKKNFFELINSYRIEEAQKRLLTDENGEQKILAIAYDVGFNTLNSFNRAFKRHTGITPTQFRNNNNNNPNK